MFLFAIKIKVSFDSDARAARPGDLTPGVNQRCTSPVVALALPARRRLADKARLFSIDMSGITGKALQHRNHARVMTENICASYPMIEFVNLHATANSFTCLTACQPLQTLSVNILLNIMDDWQKTIRATFNSHQHHFPLRCSVRHTYRPVQSSRVYL